MTESVMTEIDPTGRQPHDPGAKLDSGKPPVLRGCVQYFPRAMVAVSEISAIGAAKYAWKGWESVPDGVNRYGDALMRHLILEETEGQYDSAPGGTGKLHAAQVAWNALARLELLLREKAKDADLPGVSQGFEEGERGVKDVEGSHPRPVPEVFVERRLDVV